MDQELIVTDPDRVQAQALIQLGGSGMVPICIRHALLPFERKVLTLLENWTTPTYWAVPGIPQETLQVPGPRIRATARVFRVREQWLGRLSLDAEVHRSRCGCADGIPARGLRRPVLYGKRR